MRERGLASGNVFFGNDFSKEENKSLVKKVRVTPSQFKEWDKSLEKLGVKDFSSFARGAIQGAIEMSFRANDPKWKAFIEAIQPIASKTLGYGIFDNGASDIEGHGTERKGLTADKFIKTLETGEKPALVVKEPEKFYGGPDVKVRHYRNRVRFKARGKRKEIRVSAAKARHHGHAAQA